MGLLAFLRWKVGARRPRWQLLRRARAWHFALLPAVVAAQVVLSLLDFLHLPDILTKYFGGLNQHFGVALLTVVVAVLVLEELLFRGGGPERGRAGGLCSRGGAQHGGRAVGRARGIAAIELGKNSFYPTIFLKPLATAYSTSIFCL